MCYAEFNDIIEAIAGAGRRRDLDRGLAERHGTAGAFARFQYPNEIGPGVYDIHSPRVPEVDEIVGRLQKALELAAAGAALGQSRLRPEDPRLAGGAGGAAEHGRGGEADATEIV